MFDHFGYSFFLAVVASILASLATILSTVCLTQEANPAKRMRPIIIIER